MPRDTSYSDLVILLIFLSSSFLVSLCLNRRANNLRVYSIGNKDFSTGTLTATIVATWVSGSCVYYCLDSTHTIGLHVFWVVAAGSVGLLLTAVLSSHMEQFLNNISIAEAMRDLYGSQVQYVTAVSGVLREIGKMAIQFAAIAQVLSLILSKEELWVAGVVLLIAIAYTSLEGVRAVTVTNTFQLLVMGVLLPSIALAIWYGIEDASQTMTTLQRQSYWDWEYIAAWPLEHIAMLGALFYYMMPSSSPAMFQRIAMARDVQQVRQSFIGAAGLNLIVLFFIGWVAILLLTDHPGLTKQDVVPYLINHYTLPGYRGLLMVGILAISISTIGSGLNAAAVMLTNDLAIPWGLTFKNHLNAVRVSSVIISSLALLLAFYIQDILQLVFISISVSAPIIDVAFLLAIAGFRTKARPVLTGMVCGVVMLVYQKTFGGGDGVIWGMSANLLGLMSSHYLLEEEGGWQEDHIRPFQCLQRAFVAFLQHVETFRPYRYLARNVPSQVSFYPLIGLYTLAATHALVYGLPQVSQEQYGHIHTVVYQATFIITTVFISAPLWYQRVKDTPYIAWIWHTGLFCLLFYIGAMLVITSGFQVIQVLNYLLGLTIAMTLIQWPLTLLMKAVGVLCAVGTLKLWANVAIFPDGVSISHFFTIYFYVILAFLISIVIALKQKQENTQLGVYSAYLSTQQKELMAKLFRALQHQENFIREITQEGTNALSVMRHIETQLQKELGNGDISAKATSAQKALKEASDRLRLVTDFFHETAQRVKNQIRLEVSTVPVSLFAETIHVSARNPIFWPQPRVKYLKNTRHEELQCDALLVKQMLVSGLLYAHRHNLVNNYPVKVALDDTVISYSLDSIPDHEKLVDALRIVITTASDIPALKEVYMASSTSVPPGPSSLNDLAIIHNLEIVHAHYGIVSVMQTEQDVTQEYIIPVNLREVRPDDLDSKKALDGGLCEPISKDEADFLEEVQNKTAIDKAEIDKAIMIIKRYHGTATRKSGEAFYLHPIATAHILLNYTQDQDTIIAALLHDTVERTSMTLSQIELSFNATVRQLVEGVTHLDIRDKSANKIKLGIDEVMRRLLDVADDRVIDIKLAERLHNVRTIEGHESLKKRRQVASETLHFFVPIAYYRGFSGMAEEFQVRCAGLLNKKFSELQSFSDVGL